MKHIELLFSQNNIVPRILDNSQQNIIGRDPLHFFSVFSEFFLKKKNYLEHHWSLLRKTVIKDQQRTSLTKNNFLRIIRLSSCCVQFLFSHRIHIEFIFIACASKATRFAVALFLLLLPLLMFSRILISKSVFLILKIGQKSFSY